MAETALRMRNDKDLHAGRPQHESQTDKAVLCAGWRVLQKHAPEQQKNERDYGAKAEEVDRDVQSSALHGAPPEGLPEQEHCSAKISPFFRTLRPRFRKRPPGTRNPELQSQSLHPQPEPAVLHLRLKLGTAAPCFGPAGMNLFLRNPICSWRDMHRLCSQTSEPLQDLASLTAMLQSCRLYGLVAAQADAVRVS
jgi:hypothetical protein